MRRNRRDSDLKSYLQMSDPWREGQMILGQEWDSSRTLVSFDKFGHGSFYVLLCFGHIDGAEMSSRSEGGGVSNNN